MEQEVIAHISRCFDARRGVWGRGPASRGGFFDVFGRCEPLQTPTGPSNGFLKLLLGQVRLKGRRFPIIKKDIGLG